MRTAVIAALIGAGCVQASAQERRTVEITAAGMAASTRAVKDAVAEAVKLSPHFQIGAGDGAMTIVFPKDVEARAHMGRTEYLYRVEFRGADGQLFERNTGSCWSDEVERCVFNVMRVANRVGLRE